MDLVAGIIEQVDRLVHPAVLASPVERAQHRTFIATRFTVSIGAIAFLPLYLASGGVPGWIDSLILAWLVVPLVAAVVVASSGRLKQGEIISSAGWIGLSLTLFFGRVCGLGPAVVVLALVILEANFFEQFRMSRAVILAALAAGLTMLASVVFGIVTGPASGAQDPAFYVLALLYGAALSFEGDHSRRVKETLETANAGRYRALSDAIGDLVLRYDRSGTVLLANESAEQIVGLKAQDLMGRGFFDRLHVADRPAFLKMMSDAALNGKPVTGTLRLRLSSVPSQDGRYNEPIFAWVEICARRIEQDQDSGSGPAVAAVVRDVTTRMQREAEVERAKRDAEEASAWKDQFLATVTHELRTPLNAIIGFGEILASDSYSPLEAGKRREYAEIIHQSGQHLLSVVNSLLDLSKIDAGKFELIFEPFDLGQLIGSCCDMIGLKASSNRIDLVRELGAPCEMVGDKRACRQIVINLLSNALKFTPEHGKVTVTLKAVGDCVEIAVSDTGIGIRDGDMHRLGDPFFQAQHGYNRAYEGTGLGLSVVSGLVGLHGGTIAADSAPGEGTRMTVRLPQHGRPRLKADKTRIEVISRAPPRAGLAASPNESIKVQKIA